MGSSGKKITAAEVQSHAKREDCWLVVQGKVYDLTRYAPDHPGGNIIYAYAGKDATEAYLEVHEPNLIKSTLQQNEQVGEFDTSTSFPDAAPAEDAKVKQKQDNKPSLDTFINLYDFEDAAKQSLSEKSFTFISGASNDNITRDANHDLYRKIWFRPRVMRNVANVSTKATVMGSQVSLPIWISPMGVGKSAGPEGELALSRGAAASDILYMVRCIISLVHIADEHIRFPRQPPTRC
jgi:L-lactate dehydrogenase (cytochrome)